MGHSILNDLLQQIRYLEEKALNNLEGICVKHYGSKAQSGSRIEETLGGNCTIEQLNAFEVEYFGKKGELSALLKQISHLTHEEKRHVGQAANILKQKLTVRIEQEKKKAFDHKLNAQLAAQRVDVSAPGIGGFSGSKHLITQIIDRIVEALSRIGFSTVLGPEVETEYLNFEAVNMPKDHPARDMQDTFFLSPGTVLRTHTSAVQIRALLKYQFPLQVICPGAVYRSDYDATHTPMFHQIEALWVDTSMTVGHLKGTLEYLVQAIFGSHSKVRLRTSYFPFVEPGLEADVSCFLCIKHISSECKVCKGTGWIEVLGAGMVHPKLFEAAGITKKIQGFAFGLGVERFAMLLSKVPDIRLLYSGDTRFLKQF
jgi:phenylalanyl-tRNA synthetase alpha chain